MPERMSIVVLFGGRSVEHEVSIRSARSVIAAVDRSRYEVLPVAIDPDGRWFTAPNPLGVNDPAAPQGRRRPVWLVAEPGAGLHVEGGSGAEEVLHPECYLPLVHGVGGEDGTLQGLFEMAEVPYAGAGVLASALAMDKALCKVVLRQAGIPVLDGQLVARFEWQGERQAVLDRIRRWHEPPLFIKPSNGGSSVGVTRVETPEELGAALDAALSLDLNALVEPAVDAREIEVSVLGNDQPRASVPGEIVPARPFYDYRAKYEDERTRLLIPAPVDAGQADRLGQLAVETFRALGACGLGRVDFLMERGNGTAWVSEMNTLPGFTDISMYPKLWEATGIGYADLIDRIVTLGRERHAERRSLRRCLRGAAASDRVV